MSTKLTAQDIATLPPLDFDGQIQEAGRILIRCRKIMEPMSTKWQNWIADSLKVGIKVEQPEVPE